MKSPTERAILREYYKAHGLFSSPERDACGLGFIYSTQGPSPNVIHGAQEALSRIGHRGAKLADEKTGDGAGLRLELPAQFLTLVESNLASDNISKLRSITTQSPHVAVGQIFFNRHNEATHRHLKEIAEDRIREYLLKQGFSTDGFLWRSVEVNTNYLGPFALESLPAVEQLILPHKMIFQAGERDLYALRLAIEQKWMDRDYNKDSSSDAYICSLSADSIVYKGMSSADNLMQFYPDLQHKVWENITLALLHERFSTNTTSTPDKAHSYRIFAHNGEFNTLRGNILYFLPRMQSLLRKAVGEDLAQSVITAIQRGASDTGTFDNIIELLTHAGLTLPTAMTVMIQAAYGHDELNHQTVMRAARSISNAWDGPAAMVGFDRDWIVVARDRTGLRPMRLLKTKSGLIMGGSEKGMFPLKPEDEAGTIILRPGDKLVIDRQRRILMMPSQVEAFAARELQREALAVQWRERGFVFRPATPELKHFDEAASIELFKQQARAQYTAESLGRILDPMITDEKEAAYSMGDDTALAAFDPNRSQDFLYAMMRQDFAQVTNPPIDSINEREGMISRDENGRMSLNMPIGNLGSPLPSPLLWSNELASLEEQTPHFVRIRATYDPKNGEHPMRDALRQLQREAEQYARSGKIQIVLTHEDADPFHLPIPMPLAVSAVHSHLTHKELRGPIALFAHTEEFIDAHKLAMLVASGANAVCPYLVENTIDHRWKEDSYGSLSYEKVFNNYRKSLDEGFLKIIAKMGITVPASYVGGYNYVLIGLATEDTKEFFPWTVSPIGGLGLNDIQIRQERHRRLAQEVIRKAENNQIYRLAKGNSLRNLKPATQLDAELAELHMWSAPVYEALQLAGQNNSREDYQKLVALQDFRRERPIAIRDLFEINFPEEGGIDVNDVEPVENILDHLTSASISFGSISAKAHLDVALAMNNLRARSLTGRGPKSCSGEGGEDVVERHFLGAHTMVKQIASGRFGVHALYLRDAEVIEIKIAQGAKPGEGGQLRGDKVKGLIAELRCATPGVTLISPPPHHDIYSIEDLAELIYDLKALNPKAIVRVKLVSHPGIGQIAVGVTKAGADEILIAGHVGGTGASPLSSIKFTGCSLESGLSEAHQTLKANDLREQIRLIADGGVLIGSDILKLKMLGADEVGMGSLNLVILGCVMTRNCHLNNCPTGIATQDPRFEIKYRGKPEHIQNYLTLVAEDIREQLARLGAEKMADIVGRVDLLTVLPHGAKFDFHKVLALHDSERGHASGARLVWGQRNEPPPTLDQISLFPKETIEQIQKGFKVYRRLRIDNTKRAVGAHLAGHIASKFVLEKIDRIRDQLPRNADGKPDPIALRKAIFDYKIEWPAKDALHIDFAGDAGQSFGAFLVPGMKLSLTGAANDYVGKGMMGGTITIRPHPQTEAAKAPDQNDIVGNTVLYGATGGEVFISGRAHERFLVCGSGARAVIEGCGDYGCEYMKGGTAVILGPTGRFFGSGMKGGLAFLYDEDGKARDRINRDDVQVHPITNLPSQFKDKELAPLMRNLIERHFEETGSPKATQILDKWNQSKSQFLVAVPNEIVKLCESHTEDEVDLTAFFNGQPAIPRVAQRILAA